jgi:ABC-type transport system involved in multi-copper enzyme maturation permease subunit
LPVEANMKAVQLIAANYLREQRWAVVLLLVWVVLSAALAGVGQLERADVLFFLKQQAMYGVAFSTFLAASSIYNERRSKRILGVLSKGIERRQYLAGLLGGVLLAAVIYVTTIGVFGSVLFSAAGLPLVKLWELLVLLLAACALAATTAVLFATFTPPIVAVALSVLAFGGSVGLAQIGITSCFLPVYNLIGTIASYPDSPGWTPEWPLAIWGAVQAVLLWLAASWIFGRRDIAVAVE